MEVGRGVIAFLKNRHSRILLPAKFLNILPQVAPDISAPFNNKAWNTKSDIFGWLEPLFGLSSSPSATRNKLFREGA